MPTRTRQQPFNRPSPKWPRADPNQTRRELCTHLGRQALDAAPRVLHSKWTHLGSAPPHTPSLPHGSLWGLLNHLKVLHQYVELISEAAGGAGVHSAHLCGHPESCANGLEWFAPLLRPLQGDDEGEYRQQVATWRQANPGLFSDSEAAYLVHQGYIVEDANMTRLLARLLLPRATELDAEVAGNILRAGPHSFDDFHNEFTNWRAYALYHLLCVGARHMPSAEQWAGADAACWQEVLDSFNAKSFCSDHRLEEAFEALQCRPQVGTRVCAVLDRLAILARVHSVSGGSLDDLLPRLRFETDPSSPYAQCQKVWGGLFDRIRDCVPPSLLCPSLYPPNRDTWGYSRLQLRMRDGRPYIDPGPLGWLEKGRFCKEDSLGLPDRLHDILLRMGEAATAPEVAHLMLSPDTLGDILAGQSRSVPDFSDRDYVLSEMAKGPVTDPAYFDECVRRIAACLPTTTHTPLPTPMHLLSWRVDCPPRAIVYLGATGRVDLSATPPYCLPKEICLDKMANRTVSGISLLAKPSLHPADVHDATRACIAEEVVQPLADFADHPHHPVRTPHETIHTTTLAEAVALFTGPAPAHLSEAQLPHSAPWNEPHVDDRYAERQLGSNGLRYRDWATVYHDGCELQRCRLAAHALRADALYHTHFPLAGHPSKSWVSVASTLPAETVVLRHQQGRGALDSLKRTVEMRFLHDGKLLPTRGGDKVDRAHMEIYSDTAAGQVLIAYAEGARLEFMSFALA
jgi:hypothetical protein